MVQPIRTAIRIEGIVQGVGFRPFVYTLATGLGLSGFVGNDVDGVFVEVEGSSAAVTEFLLRPRLPTGPGSRWAKWAVGEGGSTFIRRDVVTGIRLDAD